LLLKETKVKKMQLLLGEELRKKGAAVEAVGWSNRVCWRKTVLLHGEGPSLLEEEENQRAKGSGRSLFVLPEREGLELEGKSWDGDERKWGKC
jgi:hypothetical protein